MLTSCWYFLMTALYITREKFAHGRFYPVQEKLHDPELHAGAPERVVNGTYLPGEDQTPDWRLEEPPWYSYKASYLYQESGRPYRISPHYKQTYAWSRVYKMFREMYTGNPDQPKNLGCYCTTVYKRLTVLAGCAVLTNRHVLTTATSTELVIRDRRNDKNLENILGLWYDIDYDVENSSMYATPARIHYHPRYIRPSQVNASHPLPFTYDLAVWATTYPMHQGLKYCSRANSGWFSYGSTVPLWSDLTIIVGFQYIRALRKRPKPWFKYAVRTRSWVIPCPKTDWGWFHCLEGEMWSKYGIESGAAWHRSTRGGWLNDGLAGMCAFSLRLRSDEIIHYFTVINTHSVLDFLYDAYMGRLPYDYLDQRFYDTQWRAPRPKTWYSIPWSYPKSEQSWQGEPIPWY